MQGKGEIGDMNEHTGRKWGSELRQERGDADMERSDIKEGGGEDRAEKSNADEDTDLFAMLDGTSIKICKDSRALAISDVLSEDGDTLPTEEEDNVEDGNKGVLDKTHGGGRENIQILTLVDELTEASSSHEDGQVAETDLDEDEVRGKQ